MCVRTRERAHVYNVCVGTCDMVYMWKSEEVIAWVFLSTFRGRWKDTDRAFHQISVGGALITESSGSYSHVVF